MMLTDDISLWSAKVYLDTSNYLLNFWLNLRCSCIRRWEIPTHVYRDEQKEAQPLWFVSQDTPKHIWVLVPTTSMLLPPLLFYWVAQKQAASSAKLCVFALFVIVSVFFCSLLWDISAQISVLCFFFTGCQHSANEEEDAWRRPRRSGC